MTLKLLRVKNKALHYPKVPGYSVNTFTPPTTYNIMKYFLGQVTLIYQGLIRKMGEMRHDAMGS